jgi:hypothetical protein
VTLPEQMINRWQNRTEPAAGHQSPDWSPHVTICYSTANQPARPIIDALGLQLPSRTMHVSALSLVIQHGPEREWNWTTVETIRLPAPVRL